MPEVDKIIKPIAGLVVHELRGDGSGRPKILEEDGVLGSLSETALLGSRGHRQRGGGRKMGCGRNFYIKSTDSYVDTQEALVIAKILEK